MNSASATTTILSPTVLTAWPSHSQRKSRYSNSCANGRIGALPSRRRPSPLHRRERYSKDPALLGLPSAESLSAVERFSGSARLAGWRLHGIGEVMVPRVRVVIAEDDPGMRMILNAILDANETLDVVAATADADAAIEAARAHQPDVCVLDVSMPGG